MSNEFNRGARHGFKMALFTLRNIDKQISDYEGKDTYNVGKFNLYNIKKDFLHEIYRDIKKEMESEVDEE
jgi:hypothetical protein